MKSKYSPKYTFMFRMYLVFLAILTLVSHLTFGQESAPLESDHKSVPFYKWEVGVDLLPLADKSKDAFGYIVKRNFQTANGLQSLRFKLLPRLAIGPGTGSGADEKQSSIYLAIGFERQKMYGRFSVLYGVEPYLRHSSIKITSTTTGLAVVNQTDTKLGVSGFIGGRYYVGNHISVTLESHLVYQYSDLSGNDVNLGIYFSRAHQLFAEPLHALYIGYQF